MGIIEVPLKGSWGEEIKTHIPVIYAHETIKEIQFHADLPSRRWVRHVKYAMIDKYMYHLNDWKLDEMHGEFIYMLMELAGRHCFDYVLINHQCACEASMLTIKLKPFDDVVIQQEPVPITSMKLVIDVDGPEFVHREYVWPSKDDLLKDAYQVLRMDMSWYLKKEILSYIFPWSKESYELFQLNLSIYLLGYIGEFLLDWKNYPIELSSDGLIQVEQKCYWNVKREPVYDSSIRQKYVYVDISKNEPVNVCIRIIPCMGKNRA